MIFSPSLRSARAESVLSKCRKYQIRGSFKCTEGSKSDRLSSWGRGRCYRCARNADEQQRFFLPFAVTFSWIQDCSCSFLLFFILPVEKSRKRLVRLVWGFARDGIEIGVNKTSPSPTSFVLVTAAVFREFPTFPTKLTYISNTEEGGRELRKRRKQIWPSTPPSLFRAHFDSP